MSEMEVGDLLHKARLAVAQWDLRRALYEAFGPLPAPRTDHPDPPPADVPWLKARVAYLEGEVARLIEIERECERLQRELAARGQPQD